MGARAFGGAALHLAAGWRNAAESLDGEAWLDPVALAQNLHDLARIKRWLGYERELWRALRPTLRRAGPGPLILLDLAAGGAELPAALAARAARAGLALHVAALDLHPQVAREARCRTRGLRQVAVVRADALRLPLAASAVDVAHCSFTLHHFAWQQACALLAGMARAARLGVIVSDLARSRPAYWAAWAATSLFVGAEHRFTRHDGPLSMRRAYTPAEVRRLAAEAGLAQPLVVRRSPFHFTLLAPAEAFAVEA